MRVEFFPGTQTPNAQREPWFVRIRASNDEITLSSEAYTRKGSARRAARKTGKTFGLPVAELNKAGDVVRFIA